MWGEIFMERQLEREICKGNKEPGEGGRESKNCKERRVSTRSMGSVVSRTLECPWDLARKRPP